MSNKFFYVDSCIWLNLFKKEGDPKKGKPYWEIAKDFLEYVSSNGCEIFISSFISKEIFFKAKDIFKKFTVFYQEAKYIHVISVEKEDYTFARKLESCSNFEISFYDCLHIIISKRLNAILVTRDRKLIDFAKKYIIVKKPEDLFN
ncbi:PIN domain-containing protein [Candidatus Woesearchaeota archaeon]|nr:PIN domain-containing protein [Candidatus Woesearchaeota archaeon]MBW2978798.1 PIN domain-containing protein [Candidatus Woesearchaeota archaeon]